MPCIPTPATTPSHDEFILLHGAALRLRHRPGRGMRVFWVHEFGGSVESWSALWAQLPFENPFCAHDLRGAGLSQKLRGHPDIRLHVDDLAALLHRDETDGPAVLVGAALGAAVALGVAARHPERVAGVLALAPALGVDAATAQRLHARADALEHADMHSALQASMAASWPPTLRDPSHAYEAYVARWLGNDPGSFAAGLRLIATMDPVAWLPDIRCPVRIVAGAQDTNRTPAQIAARVAALRDVRIDTVDAGHFLALQAPELLAPVCREFFQGVMGQAAAAAHSNPAPA